LAESNRKPENSRRVIPAINRIEYWLGVRDHSELELRTKLKKYNTTEEITAAIEDARSRRWLRDPEVLSGIVSDQLDRRGKGHAYIRNFLRKKGLPPVAMNLEAEVEKAQAFLERRLRPGEGKDKASRLLRNRGYDSNVIYQVLRQLKIVSVDIDSDINFEDQI
jgi:SOS response regulatory protein OraA/RecX